MWFRRKDITINPVRNMRRLLNKYTDTSDDMTAAEGPGKMVARIRPDPVYLVLFLILLTTGTIMSFSAGSAYAEIQYGDSLYFLNRQLIFIAVGLIISFVLVMYANPVNMRLVAVASYIAAVLLLGLVFVIGETGGGAQRWIGIGPITVQPSEVAKTALVLILALYMSVEEKKINSRKLNAASAGYGLGIPALIIGIVVVPVVFEHHLSGAIILTVIGVAMMFFGGADLRWFLCGIPVAGVALIFAMNVDYTRRRIDSWLNRGADALGSDWQSTQGLYAIGTGGLFGLGLGQSRLKYGYVSQPQNDFVFTVVCEELGFFGAVAIMLLFVALVARGFVLAAHASDKFCSLVILGLSFKLALQVMLNIGVVSGVLPNTGISLPYFSTGGSAVVMQIVEAGMILSLSRFCTQKRA